MVNTIDKKDKRQSFSYAFKCAVVAGTFEPGASVTAVARRHGLKPNPVFTWRTIERLLLSAPSPTFLPVEFAVPASEAEGAPVADGLGVTPSTIDHLELVLPCATRLTMSSTISLADVAY